MVLGWGARQRGSANAEVEHVLPTRVLGKFLEAMGLRFAPVLIDLGAVVGSNVTFLGERLGCKLTVEDLFADIERLARESESDLTATLVKRFQQEDATVDGILCWDLFDYLDKASAAALGRELARILRPGGALMGFFATMKVEGQTQYTRFAIKDDKTLAHRPYAGSRPKQPILTNRDIALLFPGLKVSDSFLLLSHTREVLFRKELSAHRNP
jgi:hypothetical protein